MEKKKLCLIVMTVFILVSVSYAQVPDTLWTKTYGRADYDHGHSIQQTSDSGYVIAGVTNSYGAGSNDVYLVKTRSVTSIEDTISRSISPGLQISPNPVTKQGNIKYTLPQDMNVHITLYDVTGRLVKEIINVRQNAGKYQKRIDMSNLAQSVYFIRIETDKHSQTEKVVYLK